MKHLAPLVTLAVLALPASALADDLVMTFYESRTDIEYSWTVHDAESGLVPTVTLETSESEGFTLATELEFTEEGHVQMAFLLYDVTFRPRRGESPKVVTKSTLFSAPTLLTLPDEMAHIKAGNPDGYFSVTAVYVTTEEETYEETVEQIVED